MERTIKTILESLSDQMVSITTGRWGEPGEWHANDLLTALIDMGFEVDTPAIITGNMVIASYDETEFGFNSPVEEHVFDII